MFCNKRNRGLPFCVGIERLKSGVWAVLVLSILAVGSGRAPAATPYLVSDLGHGHQVLIDKGLQIGAWAQSSPIATTNWDWPRWIESNLTGPNWSTGSVGDGLLGKMLYTPSNPLAPFNNPNPELVSPAQWHTRAFNVTMTHYGHSTVYQNASVNEGLIFYGYIDEQDLTIQSNIDDARDWFAFTKGNRPSVGHFPNSIVYTNQFGSQTSTANMLTYMGQALPEMLSFDHYALGLGRNTIGENEYYSVLLKYRNLALLGNDGSGNSPIPYHTYLDLIGPDTYTRDPAMPTISAAGLRWNQMASWTFGAKAATGFTYSKEVFLGHGAGIRDSVLFAGDGIDNPTQAFYDFAETTRQSRNLGPALTRLISTDVRRQGFAGTFIPAWTSGAGGDPYMRAFTGETIIGFFNPIAEELDGPEYTDEVYFMVLNHLALGSLTDSAQTIRLKFGGFGDSGINSLQRLNRDTGLVEVLPLTQLGPMWYYDLYLEGGTADLFKYNTGAPFLMLDNLEGDANLDGVVNQLDINKVLSNWLTTGATWANNGDVTGDGLVNQLDINEVLGNWLNVAEPPEASGVPEPATLALLGIGGILAFCRPSPGRYRHEA